MLVTCFIDPLILYWINWLKLIAKQVQVKVKMKSYEKQQEQKNKTKKIWNENKN